MKECLRISKIQKRERLKSQGIAMVKASLKTMNEKALSPIFATLIILAVVTVLFIPVFIWATGVNSQNQESWGLAGTTATERIVIEEINLKNNQAFCVIYVRNIGKTAVIIDNIFINLADGTGTTHVYQRTEGDFTANPSSVIQGDLMTLNITSLGAFNPAAAATYTIKVFTSRGVSDQYQDVA